MNIAFLPLFFSITADAADIHVAPFGGRVVEDYNGQDYTEGNTHMPKVLADALVYEGTFSSDTYFAVPFVAGRTIESLTVCYKTPDPGAPVYIDEGIHAIKVVQTSAPGTSVILFEDKTVRWSELGVCDTLIVNATPTAPVHLVLNIWTTLNSYRLDLGGITLHVK